MGATTMAKNPEELVDMDDDMIWEQIILECDAWQDQFLQDFMETNQPFTDFSATALPVMQSTDVDKGLRLPLSS